jgi:hypothetical protein
MNKLLTVISAAALLAVIAGPVFADHNQKTVFVTSAKFKGNLGGLTGADDKCQAEADGPASIVPSGTYLAWLSDGFDSPDTRFTKSSHPYTLPDGTKIAEDFTDLTDGSILHKINSDPTGKRLGLQEFWTGTLADGTTAQQVVTCSRWKADLLSDGGGIHGRTNQTGSLWSTMHSDHDCSRSARLLCFQQ